MYLRWGELLIISHTQGNNSWHPNASFYTNYKCVTLRVMKKAVHSSFISLKT